MPRRILFDVDTQWDFMSPQGALSVPGAMALVPRLAALWAAAPRAGVARWASADTHLPGDPEFATYGFPPHCLAGSPGWARLPATALPEALVLPVGAPCPPEAAEAEALCFHKDGFDVGAQPAFAEALRLAGVEEAWVMGVATEFCVRAACLSLLAAGVRVWLVEDAVAAVSPGAGLAAQVELAALGVGMVRSEALLARWGAAPTMAA